MAGLRAVGRSGPGPARRDGAAVAGAGRARHARVHRLRRAARHRPAQAGRHRGRGRRNRRGRRGGRTARQAPGRARGRHRGSADKCRYAVEELGFDVCLDRRDSQLAESLAAACPNGIDVYFENVGGAVFDAVLPLLNIGARVPVCGLIAHYNEEALPPGPNRLPRLMTAVLQKRIRVQGLVILDHYADRFDAFSRDMGEWVAAGRVKLREDRVDGLENAPKALIDMLEGRNFGKLVVRVAGP
ncbi:zinc-binding dehydrogenase [Pyxidicoccus sp. 3LG]